MNSNNAGVINVVTVKGEQVTIDFDANDTVEALKAKIQVATGIPMVEQYPVFEGQLLQDGRDVKEYYLQKEGTINLVAPVKGGCNNHDDHDDSKTTCNIAMKTACGQ